jgi:hypothetical protein
MQHEQSTSAAAADPHATSIEQRIAERIRTAVLASEQRITEQFLAANVALLSQLQQPIATPATADQQQSIPADVTPATEGGKAALEPPIDLLDDETEPTASDFLDFTYYGEVIPAGLERSPRDVEEPRLLTLTDDTARALADKRTQSAYDEYLHIGCYAFFDSCANAAVSEGLDALSNGTPLSREQTAAVSLVRAGHRTHTTTEEAARTRLGFLRLTKGGQASIVADRVFAELAHERFCRPRPTAVSGPLDALRQAFVDRALEVSLHAANKAAACAAFAKVTQDKPTCLDAKARIVATDKRKAAAAAAAAIRPPPPLAKPTDQARPPPKE